MALRNIVKIDEDKCNGCGDCIINCPEGALAIIDGKARVVKESFCDGLGVCIGKCPLGAISIEQREAEEFDSEAVAAHMAAADTLSTEKPRMQPQPAGCPGTTVRMQNVLPIVEGPADQRSALGASRSTSSQLSHWPVQLTLVAADAPFLREADLLLAADCVPFAMADFHRQLLDGRVVVVGCPKLDDSEAYVAKMSSILLHSRPSSLTIVHMEVPCCSGLCRIVQKAIAEVRHELPVKDITISTTGAVIAENNWQ